MVETVVVVPFHINEENGREKYLPMTIESILDNTYSDFALLLVDDGSVPESLDIINPFLKADKRVKITRREKTKSDSGTSSEAVNKGIDCIFDPSEGIFSEKLSRGIKYFCYVHSDDLLTSHSLEDRVGAFNDSRMGAVFSNGLAFRKNLHCHTWEWSGTKNPSILLRELLSWGLPNHTFMWTAELLKLMKKNMAYDNGSKFGVFDPFLSCTEDNDVSLLTIYTTKKHGLIINHVPKFCYVHRYHQDSISGRMKKEDEFKDIRRTIGKYGISNIRYNFFRAYRYFKSPYLELTGILKENIPAQLQLALKSIRDKTIGNPHIKPNKRVEDFYPDLKYL